MNRRFILGLVIGTFTFQTAILCGAVIADFEDLVLNPQQAIAAEGNSEPFLSHGLEFSRQWNSEFNCCPTGWAYSNKTDQMTPGYENAYSAIARSTAGGGFQSDNFGVVSNLMRGEAQVGFPQAGVVQGMYITNVTYAYRAVLEGNDGAGFVKGPFANGDWFRVEVIGLDSAKQETGRIPIYLADYRDALQVLDEWTWIDLHALGNRVASLEFEMASTDIGPFGMNTPAVFAVDNLTFEPSPTELGDLNRDGLLDVRDVNLLSHAIRADTHLAEYDLTDDLRVDEADLSHWVKDLRHTWFGDTDLNGQFDSSDLVTVFQAGKYGQNVSADWADGDWNASLRFDSEDLVAAFQDGGFEMGVRQVMAMSVPEPASEIVMMVVVIGMAAFGRRLSQQG